MTSFLARLAMDNLAHGLTGALIGYCGFRQRSDGGRAALWTAIAAAEFPDIDIFIAPLSGESFLKWHRSFTHSAIMMPVFAALVAGAIWSLSRRASFKVLWQAALAGIASHLLMDWITNYGTELLWPVSDARFALSWVFIVDVYIIAALLIGLIAAIVTQRAAVARGCLAVVCGYVLLCGALCALAAHRADGVVYAQPMNPVRWVTLRNESDAVVWRCDGREDRFMQFRDDSLLPKAEALPVVKLYRWFAAFPLVEKLNENGHTVLRYRDLRFRCVMPTGCVREGMFVVAKVVFDARGNVVAAGLSGERD